VEEETPCAGDTEGTTRPETLRQKDCGR
jgi:hypothetical protein